MIICTSLWRFIKFYLTFLLLFYLFLLFGTFYFNIHHALPFWYCSISTNCYLVQVIRLQLMHIYRLLILLRRIIFNFCSLFLISWIILCINSFGRISNFQIWKWTIFISSFFLLDSLLKRYFIWYFIWITIVWRTIIMFFTTLVRFTVLNSFYFWFTVFLEYSSSFPQHFDSFRMKKFRFVSLVISQEILSHPFQIIKLLQK